MGLQIYGIIMDFLGAVVLLLFSDPAIMSKKNPDGKDIVINEKIVKEYKMKRYLALFMISTGFILQIVSLLI